MPKVPEWFIHSYDPNLGGKSIGISFSKSGMRKKSLGYGNLIIAADSISVGNYTIPFSNLISFEKDSKYGSIKLHDRDEKYYLLWIYSTSFKLKREETGKAFSILSNKMMDFRQQHKKEKISSTKRYIKNLPDAYKEISIDDLTSKSGLQRTEIINIVESLISNGELKAEIRGNVLKLRKEPITVVSPKGYQTIASTVQDSEKKEGLLIFVSYATKDADLYNIKELAHKLESNKEIGEVLFWQEDMHDSIIEYMNDNLDRCDVVLLFCSPNALDSVP
ncbi:MAG: toll/interleukin-1 receptor domain-containing protein, partial [Promethearchaeota archaeon]